MTMQLSCNFLLRIIAITLLVAATPTQSTVDQSTITNAIEKGTGYLRKIQDEKGSWNWSDPNRKDPEEAAKTIGATAFVALTLIECGATHDDPIVKKAAEYVRQNSTDLGYTYAISLVIIFLDRLNNPLDEPLIEALSVRLLAGQRLTGGWDYHCPAPPKGETQRFLSKRRTEIMSKGELRQLSTKKEGWIQRDPKELSPEIKKELKVLAILQQQGRIANPGAREDRSNTQFANLALWVAGRHGIPAENALARVEAHYRRTQNNDGGWGYEPPSPSSPAMTCAGLLGLATGHGVRHDIAIRTKRAAADPSKDPNLAKGLQYLATRLRSAPDTPANKARDAYYFLWSLNRVGLAYNLSKIGGIDWYQWGAEWLLQKQNGDGSWQGNYGLAGVDTCFALLFLQRSKLTSDLSSLLTKGGKKESGKGELRSVLKAKENDTPATPQPDVFSQIEELTASLIQASKDKQLRVLEKMRDTPGVVNTEALVAAIPKLTGDIKNQTRDALAERMLRMTIETLRDKLEDKNLEVRWAIARIATKKQDKSLIPDLIKLLEDPEPVSSAAYTALKELAKPWDFGPLPKATPEQKTRSIKAWKTWWETQTDKKIDKQ